MIRRVYNVAGLITNDPARGLLEGPPEHWIETLTLFATQWDSTRSSTGRRKIPAADGTFRLEVVPGVRQAVERARRK